ncbi:Serine/threonine-protein kinase Nek5, partial [Plecturocebus cupreus]
MPDTVPALGGSSSEHNSQKTLPLPSPIVEGTDNKTEFHSVHTSGDLACQGYDFQGSRGEGVAQVEFRSCCPGWSAVVQSWLTATSASRVQDEEIGLKDLQDPVQLGKPIVMGDYEQALQISIFKRN